MSALIPRVIACSILEIKLAGKERHLQLFVWSQRWLAPNFYACPILISELEGSTYFYSTGMNGMQETNGDSYNLLHHFDNTEDIWSKFWEHDEMSKNPSKQLYDWVSYFMF